MFGWRDYREDGKQWVENGVENIVFPYLGSKGKKRVTREKFFLPWRENYSYHGITQMPSPTYPPHKHNDCSGNK